VISKEFFRSHWKFKYLTSLKIEFYETKTKNTHFKWISPCRKVITKNPVLTSHNLGAQCSHNFPPENFSAFTILISTLTYTFSSIFIYQVETFNIKVDFKHEIYTAIGPWAKKLNF